MLQTLVAAGTFLVAKDVAQRLPPLQVGWLRIVLGTAIMLPIYIAVKRARKLRTPTRGDIPRLIVLGMFGIVANQLLFICGMRLTTPINGALLYAFTPAMVLLAAALFLGERLTVRKVVGILVALVGVLLVLSGGDGGLTQRLFALTHWNQGDILILIAVVTWALYTLLGKALLKRYDPLTIVAWAFGVACVMMLLATPWMMAGFDPATLTLPAMLDVLYLAGMTSVIAFTLWYFALQRLEAGQVAVFANLPPPTTALLTWLVFGTLPGWTVVVGGLLVLCGVSVVQFSRQRPTPSNAPAPSATPTASPDEPSAAGQPAGNAISS